MDLSAVDAAGYSYRYVNLLTDIPGYHKTWGVGGVLRGRLRISD